MRPRGVSNVICLPKPCQLLTKSYSWDTLFTKQSVIVYEQPFMSGWLCCKQSGTSSGDTDDGLNSGLPGAGGTFFFIDWLTRCQPGKCMWCSQPPGPRASASFWWFSNLLTLCCHLETLHSAHFYSAFSFLLREVPFFLGKSSQMTPARPGCQPYAPIMPW